MEFNIKSSKKYRAVTTDGRPVRIVCWNMNHWRPIIGVVTKKFGGEFIQEYTEEGKVSITGTNINDLRLTKKKLPIFKRLFRW